MSVHYKFKSCKEFSTASFDGPFISLSDLKQRIIQQQKLNKAPDFDLEVINAQSKQVYTDDQLVPKNTSVIIRRVPAAMRTSITVETKQQRGGGGGRESNEMSYSTSYHPTPSFHSHREHHNTVNAIPSGGGDRDIENAAITSIVESATEYTTTHTSLEGAPQKGYEVRVPPASYTCYRCGQPGHFIHHCPTNGDPKFDFHKVKKPTGIPRSLLTKVDDCDASKSGTLLMPGGGFAKMTPNEYVENFN